MSHYKPYSAYKDSGIEWLGRVPEHWEVKRLRHVARFTNSNVDKKTYEGQKAVKLCNYIDVYYNEFITDSIQFMSATADESEIQEFALKQGDVLMTKDSEDPADIGIPALVTSDMPGVICGYHLTVIRAADPRLGEFLHRSIQAHPTKAHFFVESPGITRYGLGQDAIGDTVVCLPTAPEQVSITRSLDRESARIDSLIAKKARFIELLQEKRQSLITHAVTKGLDPKVKMKGSGVQWIGDVPEHWEVAAIKRWFSTVSGSTPDTSQQGKYYAEADGIPWIRTTDLNNGDVSTCEIRITEAALRDTACSVLPVDSVLVAMYGGEGTIGKNGLLAIPAAINQAVCALLPTDAFNARFTHAFVQFHRPHWMVDAVSTRKDPNISQDLVREARIVKPPVGEQKLIADYVEKLTCRIASLTASTERSINLLKERRSALITAATTGQIDLRGSA